MLRKTAVDIIHGKKFGRREACKVADILHETFSPPLHWSEKCKVLYRLWKYKKQRHEYTREKLAEYVGQNYYHVVKSLRAYEGILEYPGLVHIGSRDDALKILATSYPLGALDEYLIKNNRRTLEL